MIKLYVMDNLKSDKLMRKSKMQISRIKFVKNASIFIILFYITIKAYKRKITF